jgi:hypothetical protein
MVAEQCFTRSTWTRKRKYYFVQMVANVPGKVGSEVSSVKKFFPPTGGRENFPSLKC